MKRNTNNALIILAKLLQDGEASIAALTANTGSKQGRPEHCSLIRLGRFDSEPVRCKKWSEPLQFVTLTRTETSTGAIYACPVCEPSKFS